MLKKIIAYSDSLTSLLALNTIHTHTSQQSPKERKSRPLAQNPGTDHGVRCPKSPKRVDGATPTSTPTKQRLLERRGSFAGSPHTRSHSPFFPKAQQRVPDPEATAAAAAGAMRNQVSELFELIGDDPKNMHAASVLDFCAARERLLRIIKQDDIVAATSAELARPQKNRKSYAQIYAEFAAEVRPLVQIVMQCLIKSQFEPRYWNDIEACFGKLCVGSTATKGLVLAHRSGSEPHLASPIPSPSRSPEVFPFGTGSTVAPKPKGPSSSPLHREVATEDGVDTVTDDASSVSAESGAVHPTIPCPIAKASPSHFDDGEIRRFAVFVDDEKSAHKIANRFFLDGINETVAASASMYQVPFQQMTMCYSAMDLCESLGIPPDDTSPAIDAFGHRVGILFLDNQMPKMSGIEIAPTIKKWFPHIMIVAASGDVLEVPNEKGEHLPGETLGSIDAYLQKPYSKSTLKSVLASAKMWPGNHAKK